MLSLSIQTVSPCFVLEFLRLNRAAQRDRACTRGTAVRRRREMFEAIRRRTTRMSCTFPGTSAPLSDAKYPATNERTARPQTITRDDRSAIAGIARKSICPELSSSRNRTSSRLISTRCTGPYSRGLHARARDGSRFPRSGSGVLV